MKKNTSRMLLPSLAVVGVLSGCVGTTVVDYRVGIEVFYRTSSERELALAAEQAVELVNSPGPLVAFNYMQHCDQVLCWTTSVSTVLITNRIENISKKPLVLKWDEALLSSSQQHADIPLRSYTSSVAGELLGPKGFVGRSADRRHALVPLHLQPGQESSVSFGADFAKIFRSGRLFGVRYDPRSTRLHESGVGEWLLIKLPIEHGEERLLMHIKLTAHDAKARISHF
jgi:hypothetical protein